MSEPPDLKNAVPQVSGYLPPPESQTVPIRTSLPDAIDRHNISDEDIDVFVNSSRDGLTDAMWGSVGAFLNSIPTTISYLAQFLAHRHETLSRLALVQMLITFTSFTAALVIFIINKKKSKTCLEHAEKLRARTRRSIQDSGLK